MCATPSLNGEKSKMLGAKNILLYFDVQVTVQHDKFLL